MYLYIKRIMDIVIATAAFIVLTPVWMATALIICLCAGTSPVFVQKRPGKGGKVFRLLKFKTMYDRRDAQGNLLTDDQRISKTGRLIRRLSLDELPQLLNVIAGDMSLVGPRPLLVEYLPLYSPQQARRHEVRPGLTGWAQINGRNAIDWDRKFEYDVWYVDHVGFALDMKILWMTPAKVLKRRDTEAAPKIPMEKFTGTRNYQKLCTSTEQADMPR